MVGGGGGASGSYNTLGSSHNDTTTLDVPVGECKVNACEDLMALVNHEDPSVRISNMSATLCAWSCRRSDGCAVQISNAKLSAEGEPNA